MFAVLIYVLAIVSANLSVSYFGPWVSPINAFFFIGLDLTLRDHLHDRWQGSGLWSRMLGLICISGFISYLLNPAAGVIAIASVAAFCISAVVDAITYQALKNKTFLQRTNGSNVASSLADSIIFPAIAFGAFLPGIVALQFAAKVAGGGVWAYLINRRNT